MPFYMLYENSLMHFAFWILKLGPISHSVSPRQAFPVHSSREHTTLLGLFLHKIWGALNMTLKVHFTTVNNIKWLHLIAH